MSNQQNPITQIFVGVAIAVLSAFILWKLGLEKSESAQSQRFDAPLGDSDRGNNSKQPQTEYITIAILDRLDLEYNGKGQIAETVSVEINGETKNIILSYASGKRDGSVNFKLPEEGYYDYNLTVTTTFNSHAENGQICTHNGYGSGRVYMGDGKVYKMEYDAESITSVTSSYKAWLSEM
jgi:hypothetical protein